MTTPTNRTPPITPPGDMPLPARAPAPREGWQRTKKKRGARGRRLQAVQATNAVAAANELATSTTYVEDFGTRAPSAEIVSFLILNAAEWRDAWAEAEKFSAYCAEQRAAWEAEALAQMSALKPAFDYVAARDSAAMQKYAATARYLGAAKVVAARANATKKAKAAAEKKAV